ncbi:MAG: WGR domain-containing protein [Thiohalomonadaceae bacterium]
MRIYMQTPVTDERPPRFYHLFLQCDLLEGWTLVREWGFQGSSGRVVREHFSTREAAEEAMVQHRDAQLGRGYRVVFAKGEDVPG